MEKIGLKALTGCGLLLACLVPMTRCTPVSASCAGCISPAVSIVTLSTAGDTIRPIAIKMIAPVSARVRIDTSASRAAIYGSPGLYSLDLLYPDGGIVHLKGINAKQSTKMTCDHPVTENILIRSTGALEKRSGSQAYEVVDRSSGGGCG